MGTDSEHSSELLHGGTIEAFGDLIGRVDIVAFDPDKAQTMEYVRVRVFFDVSRPVRKLKVINLPCGGSVELRFDFERIQKRCYHFQSLTHEKDMCPLIIQERKDKALERRQRILAEKKSSSPLIQKDDPLYGVLSESQVGVDANTDRRKINPDVLQNMREYILAVDRGERRVREERVKKSTEDLDNDPRGQKSFLRLEPSPVVTNEVNRGRGKGLVFDYGGKERIARVRKIPEWSLEGIAREGNMPAFKIARSVTLENRFQSYVAQGDPQWLRCLFDQERRWEQEP